MLQVLFTWPENAGTLFVLVGCAHPANLNVHTANTILYVEFVNVLYEIGVVGVCITRFSFGSLVWIWMYGAEPSLVLICKTEHC